MSRIPLITAREELDARGQAVFDRITESRGSLLRPFELLLHSPAMAEKVAELGHVVRFGSHLADADRELVTLATGRIYRCDYVWESHLEAARAAGVESRTISALEQDGRGLTGREALFVSFVNELCAQSAVSEDTFGAVHDLLGTSAVVDMMLTVGYYTMLSYAMGACAAC